MTKLQCALRLVGLCVGGLALASCSCEASAKVRAGGGGSSSTGGSGGATTGGSGGFMTGGSGGATTGGSGGTGGSMGGSGGEVDSGARVSMTGIVVDFSTGTGFDSSAYDPLEGVEVCVEEHASIECATTGTDGTYTIELPSETPVVLTFEKEDFGSVRYAFTTGTSDGTIQGVLIAPSSTLSSWYADLGVPEDPSLGTILFGAMRSATGAPGAVTQVWGETTLEYVEGFTVTIAPDANHGPYFTSAEWEPDAALTESSLSGWGMFITAPGAYTLTFTHPELDCGSVETTVVAGFATTYVGTVCMPPDLDGGATDGGELTDGGDGPESGPVDADVG
jgi:hypothetical protein